MLRPIGLRLSETKTRIVHVDEGFDFLGFRIQRTPEARHGETVHLHVRFEEGARLDQGASASHLQAGQEPAALQASCANSTWCCEVGPTTTGTVCPRRPSATCVTFTWLRVVRWLRRKHPRANWTYLRRRYSPGGWPSDGRVELFNPRPWRSFATAIGREHSNALERRRRRAFA